MTHRIGQSKLARHRIAARERMIRRGVTLGRLTKLNWHDEFEPLAVCLCSLDRITPGARTLELAT